MRLTYSNTKENAVKKVLVALFALVVGLVGLVGCGGGGSGGGGSDDPPGFDWFNAELAASNYMQSAKIIKADILHISVSVNKASETLIAYPFILQGAKEAYQGVFTDNYTYSSTPFADVFSDYPFRYYRKDPRFPSGEGNLYVDIESGSGNSELGNLLYFNNTGSNPNNVAISLFYGGFDLCPAYDYGTRAKEIIERHQYGNVVHYANFSEFANQEKQGLKEKGFTCSAGWDCEKRITDSYGTIFRHFWQATDDTNGKQFAYGIERLTWFPIPSTYVQEWSYCQ
jgi:hypothetical protein